MDSTASNHPVAATPSSLAEFYNRHRGDALLNDGRWLAGYSTEEMIEAADNIVLGEAARKTIIASARLAWVRTKRCRINEWENLVPDELEEKLEHGFMRAAEQMQRLRMNSARIARAESLTERGNVIPFPTKARLPRARLKKGNTA